ncbi:hypothetical protein QFZ35_003801 [Arthrobacter ulcerisalmonis]|nr:hypothetical protein [Arthrobacter ulcerisalmonis]MDQ0665303.1 hypothetical protein [Arthrobacter ulcerisalmonis]
MQQSPKEPTPAEDAVSHVELNQTHEDILEYWTKQRMAEAKPREIQLPEPGPRPTDQD